MRHSYRKKAHYLVTPYYIIGAVSIYTNLQPVIASFVAIILGQDALTWDKPVAGALVLISAYIVTVVTAKE